MSTPPRKHLSVVELQFEHRVPGNVLGIGEARPRISWRVSGTADNFLQARYQIELFRPLSRSIDTPESEAFDSADISSSQSSLVPWPAKESLRSRQRIYLRVRIWDRQSAEPSEWSELAFVEAGLLYRDDWQCKRVTASWDQDPAIPKPEELYRKQFSLRKETGISRARLYITAQGAYEAEIDGKRVGDYFLTPGWQSYSHYLHYQVYDVSQFLLSEELQHCIGVRVAEGWFSGRIGFLGGHRNIWGSKTALIAQLEIEYSDGSMEIVKTDDSWSATTGPIQRAEIYNGEKFDSTKLVDDWSKCQLHEDQNNASWTTVEVLELPSLDTHLLATSGEAVGRIEVVTPVKKMLTPSGKTVLDFGQNLVGYTRIKSVSGPRGHKVSLFHAEVLEHGECARRPLRDCDALDEFTLAGSGQTESWEPRFTFHGFRYLQVDGWPSESKDPLKCLEAVVCHSIMQPLGTFSCSDKRVSRLHENVLWSMRGNFLNIPTDCPQRDERLGWTGDVTVFGPTAVFLYDCTGVLMSWLAGLAAEQSKRNNIPPLVSPNVIFGTNIWAGEFPCAVWSDVCVIAPWTLYESTGDIAILERQWPSMHGWMNALPRGGGNRGRLWAADRLQLGDWLDPTAPPDSPARGQTDPQLVANAYLSRCLDIMSRTADLLGMVDIASDLRSDLQRVRSDFAEEYITPNGRVTSDSQTAYALAICFDLLPSPKQRERAAQRLVDIVRANDFRIGTGFAGTPVICEALACSGYPQIAYRMLLEEKCPSWLYPVSMGATTIWERWDSMMPDGSVNPGEMTSFNHYALGAIATFLHERLGGLQRLDAGWKKFRVAPLIGGEFTHASVSHVTPYGKAACSWEISGDSDGAQNEQMLKVRVLVPPNTTAEVVLPAPSGTSHGDLAADEETRTVGSGEWIYNVPYKRSYDWPPKTIR